MSLLSLIAMVFWGMVLSFGYQLFLPLAERQRSVMASVLFYGGAGVVCFLSTALFLYAVSGGAWGIYGFFALLLGFWLYYSFFRIWGRRFAMAVGYVWAELCGAVCALAVKRPMVQRCLLVK